jgi:hypothetical protein
MGSVPDDSPFDDSDEYPLCVVLLPDRAEKFWCRDLLILDGHRESMVLPFALHHRSRPPLDFPFTNAWVDKSNLVKDSGR